MMEEKIWHVTIAALLAAALGVLSVVGAVALLGEWRPAVVILNPEPQRLDTGYETF